MPNNIKQGPNWVAADPTGAADIQAQQLDMQRRQELIDALKGEAAQPIEANGGRISWTQGLAKLLQGYTAGHLARQNQGAAWDIAAEQANANAAQHDPTGQGLAPVDLANNPYVHGRHHALPPQVQPMPLPAPPADAPQNATAGAPPAAPPPMPGRQPNGDPLVPTDMNVNTPRGRAQALRIAQGLDAQPIDAGSVAGARDADAPAISTPGATPNQPPTGPDASPDASPAQLGPHAQSLVAMLKGKFPGTISTLDPRSAEMAAVLKNVGPTKPGNMDMANALYSQPATQPAAQPPIPQPTLAQQHDAISAATGEPTPLHVTNALQAGQRAGQPQGAPMPQGGQQMPQQQPPAQPGPVMDAMVPTMTARQGYAMQMANPEAWSHLVEAYNMPTEAVKNALAMGLKPGTQAFLDYARQAGAKANYIAPDKAGPGEYVMPHDGSQPFVAPDTKAGLQFRIGDDGKITSAPIPGVLENTVATAGKTKQAEQDATIFPNQTVGGREGVPVTGAQVRNGGDFGMDPGHKVMVEGDAKAFGAHKADVAARVAQGYELTQRLAAQGDLLNQFRIGATAPVREKLAAFARDAGMNDDVVKRIGGGDPAAAQAFRDYAIQSALEQLRQSVGNNRMLKSEFDAFERANPNLSTDPHAFKLLSDYRRSIYQRDYQEQQAIGAWEKAGRDPGQFQSTYEAGRHGQATMAPGARPAAPAGGGMTYLGMYRGRQLYKDASGRKFVK